MEDYMINPNGMSFSNKLPMKTVDKLKQLSSIEDCYRYKGDFSLGTYYPVRFLVGTSYDTDAEWPVVMPAGTIVAIEEIRDPRSYAAACVSTGIGVSGTIPVSVGIDGTVLSKSIDLIYPRDIAGFITIANGGTDVTEAYSASDGTYGILTLSGDVASASYTFTRPANKPAGIVSSQVYADLRYRWLNYEVGKPANAIDTGGVITIPYIEIFGSGVTATVLAAVRAAVNAKHQYVWVDGANESAADVKVTTGASFMSDAYGRFTAYDSTAGQLFGKALERRQRHPVGIDDIIESLPGSNMQGTDTAGLAARIYDFIKSIISAANVKPNGYTVTKANIKSMLYSKLDTATTDVSIKIGLVDVAFGHLV